MQCKAIASKARLGILGWILAGSVMAAELKFDNGFEKGDLSGFRCSGNCPAVETNLPAGGSYSANFDLTRSMATPYRTEVTVPGEAGRFQWGTENWVGFSFRFEDWADDKDMEIAPFQVHPTPADWNDSKPESQISTGPVMMAVQAGEVRVYTYGGKIAWREPMAKGKWMRMTLRFIPSYRGDGLIEMWKDGERILSVPGQNAKELDHNGKPMRPPYWKMGVYKWNWRAGRPDTDSTRRQLYIDDLRIAKGTNGYPLVTPDAPKQAKVIKPSTNRL